jgi:hypothetical protein
VNVYLKIIVHTLFTSISDLKKHTHATRPWQQRGYQRFITFHPANWKALDLLHYLKGFDFFLFDFIVFNATFSNISAISWRPVLVVEEAGVPGETHRPWASNW